MHRGDRGGQGGGQWIEKFKESNPQEFERLKTLREQDPEAFREEMKKLIQKSFGEHMGSQMGGPQMGGPQMGMGGGQLGGLRSEKEKEAAELVRKYHESKDNGAKEELKGKITDLAKQSFDESQEQQKKSLQSMEERLKKMKEELGKRETNKDDVVKFRLENMLRDPALK